MRKLDHQLKYELGLTTASVEQERVQMTKLRVSIKNQVKEEIEKLKSLDQDTQFEFRRINLLLSKMQAAIGLLSENAMIGQLLQEQDLLDRKQIALMGLKTTQEILGKNQHAVENNLLLGPKKEERDQQEQPSGNFWKLRNRNKDYVQVVSSSHAASEQKPGRVENPQGSLAEPESTIQSLFYSTLQQETANSPQKTYLERFH